MTLPVFSPRASEDLLAIAKYIARDNLHAALNTVDKIEKRCRDTVAHPRIGRSRFDLQQGLRSLTEGDYVIFYRTLDSTIEIVRIIHSKRDQSKIFKSSGRSKKG
jgi:toxin ParE1/3/4